MPLYDGEMHNMVMVNTFYHTILTRFFFPSTEETNVHQFHDIYVGLLKVLPNWVVDHFWIIIHTS